MQNIQMVDLISQYQNIKEEIDAAMLEVVEHAKFIKGPFVKNFETKLAEYLHVNHVVSCGNGTDALQIALMAINAQPGDEVIVPSFTYVATAEVIALLKLTPVMVDVDPNTFNVTPELIKEAITEKTVAVVPVNLYGQSADLEGIMEIAKENDIYVIEDNAQALGADYMNSKGIMKKTGTWGHIGCTSFFPSKNLGCFGDGGAIYTDNDELASKISMIANHGQEKKYYHKLIGVNSRLDAIQANILSVKLQYLDKYAEARQTVAAKYDKAFQSIEKIQTPFRYSQSTHVFHQYTLKVDPNYRDELKAYLAEHGIPSMIYYPIPLYRQEAYQEYYSGAHLPITEYLCESVISLPIHTEMREETQDYIILKVKEFFNE